MYDQGSVACSDIAQGSPTDVASGGGNLEFTTYTDAEMASGAHLHLSLVERHYDRFAFRLHLLDAPDLEPTHLWVSIIPSLLQLVDACFSIQVLLFG